MPDFIKTKITRILKNSSNYKTYITLSVLILAVASLMTFRPNLSPVSYILDGIRSSFIFFADQIDYLEDILSPRSPLADVAPRDYVKLKTAVKAQIHKTGPRFAISIGSKSTISPTVYISSNLPDETKFDLFVNDEEGTLVDRISYQLHTQLSLTSKLGKVSMMQGENAKPIAEGKYVFYLALSDDQSEKVKLELAHLKPLTVEPPKNIPLNLKIVAHERYFLGGDEEVVYKKRLAEYHKKLGIKAKDELDELDQFLGTLENQLNSTKVKFNLSRDLATPSKRTQAWSPFHDLWKTLQDRVDQYFDPRTTEVLKSDFFYANLYILLKYVSYQISTVHQIQNSFFSQSRLGADFDLRLTGAIATAEKSASLLRSKIVQANQVKPASDGMPKRDGL